MSGLQVWAICRARPGFIARECEIGPQFELLGWECRDAAIFPFESQRAAQEGLGGELCKVEPGDKLDGDPPGLVSILI